MNRIIKISLAFLLFTCLLKMPYGYYQLVRFLALVGFGTLAYSAYQQKKETEMILYIALAILFQPLLKILLGRMLWNIVDILAGVGLLISLLGNREFDKDFTNKK